jgi:hypothetical protein
LKALIRKKYWVGIILISPVFFLFMFCLAHFSFKKHAPYSFTKHDNLSYKFIIARYQEDINWLSTLINDVVIINKGQPLNLPNEVLLPNVGRESESYLHYIIDNYDNLPDICVFSQAKIHDHFIDYNLGSYDQYLIMIRDEAEKYGKSLPRKVNEWNPLSFQWGKYFNVQSLIWTFNYRDQKIAYGAWLKKTLNQNYTLPYKMHPNGIFAVRRELILQHPKAYYEKLIKEVNWHVDPVEGYFFERSWYYIFD